MLQNFKVFQFSVDFYHRCERLNAPLHLRDQLLRASSSVSLNIAEGSGKPTAADQRKFYGIALGSLRECEAIFCLLRLNDPALNSLVDQLGRMLFTLAHKKKVPA